MEPKLFFPDAAKALRSLIHSDLDFASLGITCEGIGRVYLVLYEMHVHSLSISIEHNDMNDFNENVFTIEQKKMSFFGFKFKTFMR